MYTREDLYNVVTIKDLKKGNTFKFNNKIFIVRQKFSDWKKDGEPYLKTVCGQVFWYEDLEVEVE